MIRRSLRSNPDGSEALKYSFSWLTFPKTETWNTKFVKYLRNMATSLTLLLSHIPTRRQTNGHEDGISFLTSQKILILSCTLLLHLLDVMWQSSGRGALPYAPYALLRDITRKDVVPTIDARHTKKGRTDLSPLLA